MTAGAKTTCRPARTALISSMTARMAVDIAPRAIFGKPEMADLRALKADRSSAAVALTGPFNGLLTAFHERPPPRRFAEPGFKHRPRTITSLQKPGECHHEELYRTDGRCRFDHWKCHCRDARRCRLGPDHLCRPARGEHGRAGTAVRPLLVQELIGELNSERSVLSAPGANSFVPSRRH